MTWGCSHAGLGHAGRDGVGVMVCPPDLYFTTSLKSHYPHLGIQTISRSLEYLPLAFLQGVEAPESLLTYARSLKQNAPVYATCLLSYASPDRIFAQQLQTDLESQGVLCWSTPYDVEHEERNEFMQSPMTIYDMLLLVISEHTETERSRWVLDHIVKDALLKERRGFTPILLPIHLDDALQKMRGSWAWNEPPLAHAAKLFARRVVPTTYRVDFALPFFSQIVIEESDGC